MILKFRNHGGTLVAEHRVAAHFVPRVGETIVSFDDADELNGVETLLVVDVEYHLEDGVLTPTLLCAEASFPDESRLELLRDGGWLAPADNATTPGTGQ